MTAHDHTVHVPGCYRCDLSRDEATSTPRVGDQITTAEQLDALVEYFTSRGEYAVVAEGWRPWILTDNEHGDVWAHSWLNEDEKRPHKPFESLWLPLTVLYVPGAQSQWAATVEDAARVIVVAMTPGADRTPRSIAQALADRALLARPHPGRDEIEALDYFTFEDDDVAPDEEFVRKSDVLALLTGGAR